MSSSKIQTFFANAIVVIIGMLLATGAAYYVLEEIIFPMKQQPRVTEESFESITQMRGMVSLVEPGGESTSFVAVLISSNGGELRRVLIPRSSKECKTSEIVDPGGVSVGDVLDVRGESLENGDVLPCNEHEHHVVKVVAPPAVVTEATTSTTTVASSTISKLTP